MRSNRSRVAGGGWTKRSAWPRISAVRRGNSTRATSGIDASTPKLAVNKAPPANLRLPT